jgi:hypothetical protein
VRRVDVVARSADSAADRELTARLAARGLVGSSTRYERWRRAGLLPQHERHGAGQGHGSISIVDPATVEIAAALARNAVQGRDLRAAVVTWFFEAGHPVAPDEPAVPEPPEEVVARALAWAVRTDPGYRMLQRARSAITDARQDKFYEDTALLARRNPDRAAGIDPVAMREALLSGRDIPAGASGTHHDVVHLVAAFGLGAEEVGAEALADAIAATGMFPQASTQEWRDVMIAAYACGDCAAELMALARFDPAEALENAGIERLRQAREVATGLAGFGSLLLMHALLMPDTPGLAALRTGISERGMGQLLIGLARQVMQRRGIANAIAACLDPTYAELYLSLSEQVASGPPLLHLAGDETHDPQHYMQTWLSVVHEQAKQS